jgi:hypothetical protein
MRRRHVFGTVVAVFVLAAGVFAGRNSVHAQPAKASEDVLPALLAEVKGLRAAMEQMAGAGPRVQLFVGRLQLQEGRIAGMIRRLDTVRDSLVTARKELEGMKGAAKLFKIEEGQNPEQKVEIPFPFGNLKEGVAAAEANVARLVAEEAQLAHDVTTEQARWIEISRRLDELEKELGKR